ncbi:unnamed protein product [Sympodiomycopsis kandeliae]
MWSEQKFSDLEKSFPTIGDRRTYYPNSQKRNRNQRNPTQKSASASMAERSVLCLYAGGTLGMIKHDGSGYAPYPGFLTETLRTQARFHDPHADSIFSWSDTTERFKQWSEVYSQSHPPTRSASPAAGVDTADHHHHHHHHPRQSHAIHSPSMASPTTSSYAPNSGPPFSKSVRVRSSDPKGTSTRNAVSKRLLDDETLEMQLPSLITPKSSHNQQRVRYAVLEYDPLLDSSEMSLEDWTRMAKDIELNYSSFDAFVILHGTDTMSFTASAMSFLLENLGKTVIVTGAQVPLSELRNDAVENVLGALILASSFIIPEVCLFFASTLYRGNRSSKVSNNALAAFDSPNLPPLARVGIGIDVAWNLVERSKSAKSFRAHNKMSSEVALLRLFPGMPTSTIKSFLNSEISGLVIESFGAGNAPSRPDLLEAFRSATERGVVIVNITQCLQGEVSAIYAVGKKLAAVGVVAGADMTPECTLTKLAYLLSKPEFSRSQVRELMGRSIRGELTSRSPIAGSGAGRSNVSDLLARILQNPSEADQDDTDNKQSVGDSTETDNKAMEREIAAAESVILPYLISRAAAQDDVASLDWHLAAMTRLEQNALKPPPSSNNGNNLEQGDIGHLDGSEHHSSSNSSQAPQSSSQAENHLAFPIDSCYPLHISSSKGNLQSVERLLKSGSSVHFRDYANHTPLFLAARNFHHDIVKVLRDAGAHLSQEEVVFVKWLLGNGNVHEGEEEDKSKEVWKLAGIDI